MKSTKFIAAAAAGLMLTSLAAPSAQAAEAKICGHKPFDITVNNIKDDCPDYALATIIAVYNAGMAVANKAIDCVQVVATDPLNTSINDINECFGLISSGIADARAEMS